MNLDDKNVKCYRHIKSKTIHLVGDFPEPLHRKYSQCGKPLRDMTELTKWEVKYMSVMEVCIKCRKLLDI